MVPPESLQEQPHLNPSYDPPHFPLNLINPVATYPRDSGSIQNSSLYLDQYQEVDIPRLS
jgi:hypothetical protein